MFIECRVKRTRQFLHGESQHGESVSAQCPVVDSKPGQEHLSKHVPCAIMGWSSSFDFECVNVGLTTAMAQAIIGLIQGLCAF